MGHYILILSVLNPGESDQTKEKVNNEASTLENLEKNLKNPSLDRMGRSLSWTPFCDPDNSRFSLVCESSSNSKKSVSTDMTIKQSTNKTKTGTAEYNMCHGVR